MQAAAASSKRPMRVKRSTLAALALFLYRFQLRNRLKVLRSTRRTLYLNETLQAKAQTFHARNLYFGGVGPVNLRNRRL